MASQLATRQRRSAPGDSLFAQIGAFLTAQGLSADPANYAVAHHLLTRTDDDARAMVARLAEDGVRLTRGELEAMGGPVAIGAPVGGQTEPRADAEREKEAAVDRLVAQTREQADAVAGMMHAMHHVTRGFGRDLAERAAAIEIAAPASSGEVIRLTHAMIGRVADAEARLADAANEADALRAQLAEAQATARRDPLTGLTNRRGFDEAFAALDPDLPACLALVDVDRFKRINDGFGHAVGDRVLRAVTAELARVCDGHLVTRQGGEEFAVLMTGLDRAAATRLVDDAREAVGERRFRTRDTDAAIGRVSFSAGVVAIRHGEAAADALARADRLLYRAKDEGRDRVLAG